MDNFQRMNSMTQNGKTISVEEFGKILGWKDIEVYKNSTYQVIKRPIPEQGCIHLSIKRIDKDPIHDWRDLQEIKNKLVGEECEGVEIYPAESRIVDMANQYHLWVCPDPTYRFEFGFLNTARLVSGEKEAMQVGAKQRPFNKEKR
jgi:hypothetical protein